MYLKLSILFLFSTVCLSFAQTKEHPSRKSKSSVATSTTGQKITYAVIPAANNTWGYDIFDTGKILVHQPQVPSLPGNEGFKTKKAAESVAKLVVSKIEKGEMPPTVTQQELKKLNAI